MRLFCVLLCACGYSLAQAERAPKGFARLYVNQAMDAAMDVGPAATLTRVLRQRVSTSSAVSLVALNQAEAVLEARIDNISDAASIQATANSVDLVSVPSYVARVTGSIRLVDASGAVAWSAGNVVAEETYLAGTTSGRQGVIESAVGITENNRRRALERAAERLANDLYARLVEGF